MSVTLKWIEPEELGDYLKKGWTEIELRAFSTSEKFLIASPEEPASEPAKVECPNCGAAVEQPWAHYPGGWRCPTLPAQPEAPGLLEAVQRISDSIGWRSTQGDDPTLYYCEFCSEAHPDWRNVPHHDECPVFVIRAAIAKATTPMSNKPAQPEPVSAAFATEGEDQDESEPLYLPGENASSTLPNRCRQRVQSPGCKPAQPEPVAASEERALPTMQEIHDATTLVLANPLLHKVFNWLAGVTASRAIFAEPASEGGKVEFKNCHHSCGASIRFEDGLQAEYHDCQPAQPEPVAQCRARKGERCDYNLAGQCIYCREFKPEPVAEEMPHELRNAVAGLRLAATNYSDGSVDGMQMNIAADRLESFWRAQAAEGRKVRMPKVRELLDHLDTEIGFSNKIDVLTQAAFAELDAVEGKGEGRG